VPFWWAEVRLLFSRRAAALRAEHAQVGQLLEGFATEAKLPTTIPAKPRAGIIYRPPLWMTATVSASAVAGILAVSAWLLRDRPIEWLRQDAPPLHEIGIAQLNERMAADERALLAVIRGLGELE
jgi:hypothetical protein